MPAHMLSTAWCKGVCCYSIVMRVCTLGHCTGC